MSVTPRWRDWDRNPSEPVFTDYTYVSFDGERLFDFPNCLDYRLTPFLNGLSVGAVNVDRAFAAYGQFNSDCAQVVGDARKWLNMDNEIVKLGVKAKIQEIGGRIAAELKNLEIS